MTIETIIYDTLEKAKEAKLRSGTRHQNKWVPLKTIVIENKYQITWVNGIDDPANSSEAIQQRQDALRQEELREKLRNRTISQPELLELLEKVL